MNEHTDDTGLGVDLDSGAPGESLRDRLQAEREELREAAKTIDLVVPGWPTVGLRYQAISPAEFEQLAKQVKREKDGASIKAIYKLIGRCFEAVVVRADVDDEEFQILEDDAGNKMALNSDLAEYLGFEAANPTEVLRGLFSADKFPLAPATHATALVAWMEGRGDEIDGALLGE